jgi:porin
MHLRLLPAGFILLFTAASAFAQTSGTTGSTPNTSGNSDPTQQRPSDAPRSPAQENVAPTVEYLFGDWGGIRTDLESRGVYSLLDATSEFDGNVTGGVKQGATAANQLGFESDIDWQRLAGITGLSTHVIIVNRSGSSDSALFGDNFLPVQEIYGSGGDVAVHFVSGYAQLATLGGKVDLAAGRMNVENDFASSPLYCTFMNNGLCGDPKALPGGDIGHSAYPNAVWAARVRAHPSAETYIATGVYGVSQGLYGNALYRSGWKFDTSMESGVYLPVELGYTPLLGPDKMPGHYKIGFGYDTSSTFRNFDAMLAAEVNPGAAAMTHTGNTQLWVLVDQMIRRQGPGDQDGVILLGGFVRNDPNNSAYGNQFFVGAIDRGFWSSRPKDTIGLLFNYNAASRQLSSVQRQEQALGLPLSNNATGIQRHEIIVEANYNIRAYRGVYIEPDFQYVVHPNAQANIRDAVVLGLRAHVEF